MLSHVCSSSNQGNVILALTIEIGASTTSLSSTKKFSIQVSRHLRERSPFGYLIHVLVTEGRTQEERKLGLSKLRLITDHIMLRRLKQEHTSSMELPPKTVSAGSSLFHLLLKLTPMSESLSTTSSLARSNMTSLEVS
jgi:hypothetical protein